MKTDPRAARLLVGLLVGWFSQAAWAGMELNGVVGTENYLGTHQGEFFDFRNANWFQLKIKADPHEQVAVHANLELRNTNFTQVQTIDELWDRGTLEPVSWRINEAYMDVFGFLLDTDWAVLDLRAGKQVLGWGEADGFNPSDKFDPLNLENPLDFKEKLGNVSIKAVLTAGDELFSLEAVLVPRFLPSVLPIDLFLGDNPLDNPLMPKFDDSLLRQSLPPGFEDTPIVIHAPAYEVLRSVSPDTEASNLMAGGRVRWSMLGFDWSVSYAHARETVPVPRRVRATTSVVNPGQDECVGDRSCLVVDFADVELLYPKVEVFGLNLRGSVWDIGLWAEAALILPEKVEIETIALDLFGQEQPALVLAGISDEPYTKWVVGAEYTFPGGYYFNLQWVHGFFVELTGHKLHDYLFCVFRKSILSDRLQFELSLGGELDTTLGRKALGGLGSLNLRYKPFDGAQIEIGYVLARGQAGTTFEVFEPLDQVYLKFRADF
jgi:hypothetical protein